MSDLLSQSSGRNQSPKGLRIVTSFSAGQQENGNWDNTTLKVDPRSELPIIDVPAEYLANFRDLQGTLLHYFCSVGKYNSKGILQTRILIISDTSVYVCQETGSITRCIQINQINEVITSKPNIFAIKMPAPEYDLFIRTVRFEHRENALHVMRRVYRSHMGSEMPIREAFLDPNLANKTGQLVLDSPAGWELKVDPIKTKKALLQIIQEKQKKSVEDKVLVETEIQRLKQNLRAEIEGFRKAEFDSLVAKVKELEDEVKGKGEEIEHLKHRNQLDLYGPETWRLCPNCITWRRTLEANPVEAKQKVVALTRELEIKTNLVRHMQLAVEHREGHTGLDVIALQRLADQLRDVCTDIERLSKGHKSLPPDYRERVFDVLQRVPPKDRHVLLRTLAPSVDVAVESTRALEDKDKEIARLRAILVETQRNHLEQLTHIRQLFHSYDDRLVGYLERIMPKQEQRGHPYYY